MRTTEALIPLSSLNTHISVLTSTQWLGDSFSRFHQLPGLILRAIIGVISSDQHALWMHVGWMDEEGDTMDLEDYFEFLSPDDIRIKGHRIGIDDVLYYYLEGYTPEEIAVNLPTLSLEQIHAAITYYLHNRSEMDAYLSRLVTWRDHRYQEWATHPSPIVQRLRELKAQRADEYLGVP